MKRYIPFLVLFSLLIGTSVAQNATTSDVNAFKLALEKDGFTVQEGKLGPVDLIKMYSVGFLPTAGGNNPSTKYLGYFVPPAPGHVVDPALAEYSKALGLSGNTTNYWNLRPDEAVVFVGRTPPECRYFSFDSAAVRDF